jgi:hypothetical protein
VISASARRRKSQRGEDVTTYVAYHGGIGRETTAAPLKTASALPAYHGGIVGKPRLFTLSPAALPEPTTGESVGKPRLFTLSPAALPEPTTGESVGKPRPFLAALVHADPADGVVRRYTTRPSGADDRKVCCREADSVGPPNEEPAAPPASLPRAIVFASRPHLRRYGSSTVEPVVLRASRSRCACTASFSGYV